MYVMQHTRFSKFLAYIMYICSTILSSVAAWKCVPLQIVVAWYTIVNMGWRGGEGEIDFLSLINAHPSLGQGGSLINALYRSGSRILSRGVRRGHLRYMYSTYKCMVCLRPWDHGHHIMPHGAAWCHIMAMTMIIIMFIDYYHDHDLLLVMLLKVTMTNDDDDWSRWSWLIRPCDRGCHMMPHGVPCTRPSVHASIHVHPSARPCAHASVHVSMHPSLRPWTPNGAAWCHMKPLSWWWRWLLSWSLINSMIMLLMVTMTMMMMMIDQDDHDWWWSSSLMMIVIICSWC